MDLIANLMADVITRRKAPQAVRGEVIELRRAFPNLHYCDPLATGVCRTS